MNIIVEDVLLLDFTKEWHYYLISKCLSSLGTSRIQRICNHPVYFYI
jgi:hypothetical protein